jgi:hypothetical protein
MRDEHGALDCVFKCNQEFSLDPGRPMLPSKENMPASESHILTPLVKPLTIDTKEDSRVCIHWSSRGVKSYSITIHDDHHRCELLLRRRSKCNLGLWTAFGAVRISHNLGGREYRGGKRRVANISNLLTTCSLPEHGGPPYRPLPAVSAAFCFVMKLVFPPQAQKICLLRRTDK